MSSMLQFQGQIIRGRLGLQFYLTDTGKCTGKELELFTCPKCGKEHPKLAVAFRRPIDMIGCWVRFRYNGELHAPDLSVPIAVSKMPRKAQYLSEADCAKYWHM